MPQPKSLSAYASVLPILQAARRAGGARFQPRHTVTGEPGPGVAINWKQRAYTYRKLLLEADARAHEGLAGYVPKTEWDDLHLSFDPADPTTVLVQFGSEAAGQLTGLDGKPLAMEPNASPAVEDPALAEALALVQEKGV